MTEDYSDIINHPHHVSHNHPQMPMYKRAAQFMPFAALKGYEETNRPKEPLPNESYNVKPEDDEFLPC